MNTTTQKHFADMCGITKQSVHVAIKEERIAITMDRKVNLDNPRTKEFLAEKRGEDITIPQPKKRGRPKKSGNSESVTILAEDGETFDIKALDEMSAAEIMNLPKMLIDKLDRFEKYQTTKTKREELQGTLIGRDMVRRVFAQLHTIDNNQWKTLEDRVIPQICGIFGLQDGCPESFQARKLITDEVTKTLRYCKRLMDDFLKRCGAEKL